MKIVEEIAAVKMMNGNEAVARGAYEAGVKVAAGYPGTPSTEVMDYTHHYYPEIYCEWSTNEKVAVEVAIGASFAGYRSFALMKTAGFKCSRRCLVRGCWQSNQWGLGAGGFRRCRAPSWG